MSISIILRNYDMFNFRLVCLSSVRFALKSGCQNVPSERAWPTYPTNTIKGVTIHGHNFDLFKCKSDYLIIITYAHVRWRHLDSEILGLWRIITRRGVLNVLNTKTIFTFRFKCDELLLSLPLTKRFNLTSNSKAISLTLSTITIGIEQTRSTKMTFPFRLHVFLYAFCNKKFKNNIIRPPWSGLFVRKKNQCMFLFFVSRDCLTGYTNPLYASFCHINTGNPIVFHTNF